MNLAEKCEKINLSSLAYSGYDYDLNLDEIQRKHNGKNKMKKSKKNQEKIIKNQEKKFESEKKKNIVLLQQIEVLLND